LKINKEKKLIIEKITGLSKEQLFLNQNIQDKHNSNLKKAFFRLEKGEPIEYIVNNAEFYGLDFYVDTRVLIPRNDTEIMVERVILNNDLFTLIDIWTWSSCVPISILKNTKNIDSCYVVDISEEALDVSEINIKKHNLNDKIIGIKGDLIEPFLCKNNYVLYKNIVITANLPYIRDEDYKNMDNSVIKYEPKIALYGWNGTWFELYEKLINQCLELRKTYKITLFIEIGFDQKQVAGVFLNKLWLSYEIFKDNGWVDRCIKISF